jgi:hypothetical protein
MKLGYQTLQAEVTDTSESFPPAVQTSKFDLESICALSLIRQHTKTDDVPSVTNELLKFYRRAAFEAAEKYTGMILSEARRVEEVVSKSSGRRSYITYSLKYPSSDGLVYVYGSVNGISDQMIRVGAGERKIRIDWVPSHMDLASCCAEPHSGRRGPSLPQAIVMYKAGISCKDDVPATIISGVLRYIAFSIMNAGDEILTVRNRASKGDVGIIGSNNVALLSGALEMWRMYDDESM